MKIILRVLTVGYLAALALALAGMHFIGEREPLTATLLFLPTSGWILPGLALLLPCLIWNRALAALLAGVAAWFYVAYMPLEYREWLPPAPGDLAVVSCNLGRNYSNELKTYIERQTPDIIALQEVKWHHAPVAGQFPEYLASRVDQFTLLSKLPILNARYVELTMPHRREPCAARYELDFHGTRIVLYNVHLPTPRFVLGAARKQPLTLVPRLFPARHGDTRHTLREQWRNRVSQIAELRAILEKETLPLIVVGDFNMPAHGSNYRVMSRGLTDAFHARGRGYGFTFPADRRPPLSLLAPWSRLDYQFAGSDWKVCSFRTEIGRTAQHLATVGRFRLLSGLTPPADGPAALQENPPPPPESPAQTAQTSDASPRAR